MLAKRLNCGRNDVADSKDANGESKYRQESTKTKYRSGVVTVLCTVIGLSALQ